MRLSTSGKGLPGRVLGVKFLGDVQRLEIAVAGFEAPLRVRTHASETFAKGAEVTIEIDSQQLLVFSEPPREAE